MLTCYITQYQNITFVTITYCMYVTKVLGTLKASGGGYKFSQIHLQPLTLSFITINILLEAIGSLSSFLIK